MGRAKCELGPSHDRHHLTQKCLIFFLHFEVPLYLVGALDPLFGSSATLHFDLGLGVKHMVN